MRLSIAAIAACALAFATVPAAAATFAKVDGDGFSVAMPGEPAVQRQKIDIPGGEVATQAWTLNQDGVIYSISTADYPEKMVAARPAADFLNEGRIGLVNQLKGSVSAQKDVILDGNKGQEFLVSSDNGEVKARSFMVGRRLYTLLVLYNPSVGAPERDAFLTSLKLFPR